jgi:hypothetical protein
MLHGIRSLVIKEVLISPFTAEATESSMRENRHPEDRSVNFWFNLPSPPVVMAINVCFIFTVQQQCEDNHPGLGLSRECNGLEVW